MIRHLKYSINNNPSLYVKTAMVLGYISALTASLTSDADMSTVPWKESYYHLNTFAVFCFLGSFYLIAVKGTPAWSNKWRNFFLFVFISSLTTIGDEIAGTGYEVGWSDLIRVSTTILIYIFIKKRKKIGRTWMKFTNGLKSFGKRLSTFFINTQRN